MGTENNKTTWIWEFLIKLAVPISIIVSGAMINHEVRLSNHDIRIAKIEQTRFSAKDANDLERRITAAIPQQWQWLKEDISEIKQMLQAYDSRLRALELQGKKD